MAHTKVPGLRALEQYLSLVANIGSNLIVDSVSKKTQL